jgi:argininosuccinate lyase
VWSGYEYGVYLPGSAVSLISSIMPQKKNPDSLEMAEGKAGHALGSLVSAFSAIKNTPFSFSQDLLEASVMYWEGHSQTLQALGLLCETIRCSNFNKKRARYLAKNNFSTVTALADFLVRKFKIPFWQAHDIVGDMVRRVHDSGRLMDGLTSQLLKDVAQEIFQLDLEVGNEEIQACLDPTKNVQAETSEGGPGRKSVEQMLSEANEYLSNEKNWLQKEVERVESAYQKIDEVQSYLN